MDIEKILMSKEIQELKRQMHILLENQPLSVTEIAFRKGYMFGVANALLDPKIDLEKVLEWAHNQKRINPPGHPNEGKFREDYKI